LIFAFFEIVLVYLQNTIKVGSPKLGTYLFTENPIYKKKHYKREKYGLGHILGDFFHETSGHPVNTRGLKCSDGHGRGNRVQGDQIGRILAIRG
jgi:hypothetical protein